MTSCRLNNLFWMYVHQDRTESLDKSLCQRSAKLSVQRSSGQKSATAHAHVDLQRQPWLGFSQELICGNPLLALGQPSWVYNLLYIYISIFYLCYIGHL